MKDHDDDYYYYEMEIDLFPNNVVGKIREKRQQISNLEDPIHVTISLVFHGSWRLQEFQKQAILAIINDYRCKKISLNDLENDDIDPGIQEILTKVSKHWKELRLEGEMNDFSFEFIHSLIISNNGGIERLTLDELVLSEESWALFNSHKLGTGNENSTISFNLQGGMEDARLVQVLRRQGISGFQRLRFDMWTPYPETFRTLGEILSSSECEISTLTVHIDASQEDQIHHMLEAIATSNSSLTELTIGCDNFNDFGRPLTETELISMGKNLYKFNQLKHVEVAIDRESLLPLEFLRPMLNKLTGLNRSLESLKLEPYTDDDGDFYDDESNMLEFSEADNAILFLLAQQFPNLSSFGPHDETLSPAVKYMLAMNGRWRKCMSNNDPELPMCLWRWILAEVEKKHKLEKHAVIASIRYEMIKHLVPIHFAGIINATTEGSVQGFRRTRKYKTQQLAGSSKRKKPAAQGFSNRARQQNKTQLAGSKRKKPGRHLLSR